MDNKKASELLKSMHRRDFLCSECQKDADECKSSCEYGQALDLAIKALELSSWIPIKTRKMTAEEIEELSKTNYIIDADDIDQWCYCCQLPDHAQDVMITTKYGIASTTFYHDNYGAYFEDYEDRDDVLAWMPLPKPYTKEDDT